jgi:hypothetical protein
MKTKIIKIDNSRTIRIPRAASPNRFNPKCSGKKLLSARKARQGWAEASRRMVENNDDQLLDAKSVLSLSSWDATEWIW